MENEKKTNTFDYDPGCTQAIQSYANALKETIDNEVSLIERLIVAVNHISGKYPEIMYGGTNHTTFYWRLNSVPMEIELRPMQMTGGHSINVYDVDHLSLAYFRIRKMYGIYTVSRNTTINNMLAKQKDGYIPTVLEMLDKLFEILMNMPDMTKDPHMIWDEYAHHQSSPCRFNEPAPEYFEDT